ncbi:MAG: hypothetical protein RM338_29630 [Nostoc sp. DedQUE12a]|nr:hypothetical protein [Nostoc sp. DedQUE12a]
MESQTVQPTVIDAQTLKQLQEEIQQEIQQNLKNSNLSNVLQKYGLSGENLLKIEYIIDLNQTSFSDDVINQRNDQAFLPKIPPQYVMRLQCYYENGRWYSC